MNTMKNSLLRNFIISVLAVSLVLPGCKKKDDDPEPAPTSKYDLKQKDQLGITGNVVFTKKSATSVQVDITLTGAPAGSHPAEIMTGSAVEYGTPASTTFITLSDVDATGKSSSLITTQTYDALVNMDGYVIVHESAANLTKIYAIGDIGGNKLTGAKKQWNLTPVSPYTVTGTVLVEKRKNGSTLMTLTVNGSVDGAEHPSEMRVGDITTVGGGTKVLTLRNIEIGANGSGIGYTTIRTLDGGTIITYDNLLVYNGYIDVDESVVNSNNPICHGNIGSNAN
jgi:hypothetical protein